MLLEKSVKFFLKLMANLFENQEPKFKSEIRNPSQDTERTMRARRMEIRVTR